MAHQYAREQEVDHRHRAVGEDAGRRHAFGRVGTRGHGLGARTDVHAHDGARIRAGRPERLPVARVDRRQIDPRGAFAERNGAHAAGGVAIDLLDREVDVPQRDQTQRDEATVGAAAPFVDHPVVVGLHAQQRELFVLGVLEELPAEAGVVGEAQRRLDVVHVHVGQPCLRLPATGAHLVRR